MSIIRISLIMWIALETIILIGLYMNSMTY